ncbi:hypothetical protein ACNSOL_00090 [Aliarcobacter lanthieri]|uniref:hypothetical protein n=1 Tax=Aliarcobacter lanthieri TaxID=1355374 RepID=UPI003AAAB054
MSTKKNKLLQEISKRIQKTEKRNKKVMLSFTEKEYKSLQSIAISLNTSIPNLIRKTIITTGIISDEENNISK